MRKIAAGLAFFECAVSDATFLRLEGTLVENGIVEAAHQCIVELLCATDLVEFCKIVLLACRIAVADACAGAIEAVEIIAEILAAAGVHFGRELGYGLFHLAGLAILIVASFAGVLAVAEETASLSQMVKGTAKSESVGFIV